MKFDDFKKEYIVGTELGIDSGYGKILCIIDFGNVNYWFNDDRQDSENNVLKENQSFRINLRGLQEFTSLFSEQVRFYYGHDPQNKNSLNFISAARHIFGKKVFTKPMQKIKHHLSAEELPTNTRNTKAKRDCPAVSAAGANEERLKTVGFQDMLEA